MIQLQTHGVDEPRLTRAVLGRVTAMPLPATERRDQILLAEFIHQGQDLSSYAGILCGGTPERSFLDSLAEDGIAVVHSIPSLEHLEDGDVVALNPGGYVRTLYRRASPHNAIFTTDRCNSYCLMCSQPPKPVNDSERIHEHLRLIELMDPCTPELGITGGEPTLLKDDLILLVERCRDLLPSTALHILSNGRLFYYGALARKLASVGHPDLVIGVPLYSDIDFEHDFVVQSAGAYDETMIGLHNLARFGVAVEIRVVVHRHTYSRLPQVAEFIYRNLPFAAHIAFMGLEPMGFAVPNLRDLWIDPVEYRDELRVATLWLAQRGLRVSIYNHQLCVVSPEVWPFCRKSISDWKNEYLAECEGCRVRESCGGFFSSSVKRAYSRHIRALESAL